MPRTVGNTRSRSKKRFFQRQLPHRTPYNENLKNGGYPWLQLPFLKLADPSPGSSRQFMRGSLKPQLTRSLRNNREWWRLGKCKMLPEIIVNSTVWLEILVSEVVSFASPNGHISDSLSLRIQKARFLGTNLKHLWHRRDSLVINQKSCIRRSCELGSAKWA